MDANIAREAAHIVTVRSAQLKTIGDVRWYVMEADMGEWAEADLTREICRLTGIRYEA